VLPGKKEEYESGRDRPDSAARLLDERLRTQLVQGVVQSLPNYPPAGSRPWAGGIAKVGNYCTTFMLAFCRHFGE
jgi:hypothetical protein